MSCRKIIRRFVVPGAIFIGSSYGSALCEKICKPSDLPIYVDEPAEVHDEKPEQLSNPSSYETFVSDTRKKVFSSFDQVYYVQSQLSQYIDVGKEHTASLISCLREESNMLPRAGAIAIGALTGLVFSLRGGVIKKLMYTTTGAATMAAICYPDKAKSIAEGALRDSKKMFTIAYNFVHGVEEGGVSFKWPSSVEDAWTIVSSSKNDEKEEPEKVHHQLSNTKS